MARVHRDGQKRDVFIYRFMSECLSLLKNILFFSDSIAPFTATGSIDEKIYQRQVTKMGLSGALLVSLDLSRISLSCVLIFFTLRVKAMQTSWKSRTTTAATASALRSLCVFACFYFRLVSDSPSFLLVARPLHRPDAHVLPDA
jgi:hypothetical protein